MRSRPYYPFLTTFFIFKPITFLSCTYLLPPPFFLPSSSFFLPPPSSSPSSSSLLLPPSSSSFHHLLLLVVIIIPFSLSSCKNASHMMGGGNLWGDNVYISKVIDQNQRMRVVRDEAKRLASAVCLIKERCRGDRDHGSERAWQGQGSRRRRA